MQDYYTSECEPISGVQRWGLLSMAAMFVCQEVEFGVDPGADMAVCRLFLRLSTCVFIYTYPFILLEPFSCHEYST